jgi:colicin import membrane protein
VKLLKTSGNIAFDRSAEQAVYKVGSFDKLQQLDIQTFEKNFRKLQLVFKPNDLRL